MNHPSRLTLQLVADLERKVKRIREQMMSQSQPDPDSPEEEDEEDAHPSQANDPSPGG